MARKLDAPGNDSDLEVPPEELLRGLRAVITGHRRRILPEPVLAGADDGTRTAVWIVAEELAGLVGQLEVVEAEMLSRPDALDVRRRAEGLLFAANALTTVANKLATGRTSGAVR